MIIKLRYLLRNQTMLSEFSYGISNLMSRTMQYFEKRRHSLLRDPCVILGPCGDAVGWGIALQAGKLRVWFPMVSLYFRFHFGPWVDSASNRNGYQKHFMEFYIWEFYGNMYRKLEVSLKFSQNNNYFCRNFTAAI